MRTGISLQTLRAGLAAITLVAGLGTGAGPVSAQVVVADTVGADSTVGPDPGLTPRGSMLRSLVIPGWGQASVGSYHRGAVFFAVRGTAVYMLFKTVGRLNEARGIETRLVGLATDSLNQLIATDSLEAERLADLLVFQAEVDSFPGLDRMRGYVEARKQQRQDWIAYTIFFSLLDVIDAYVNAHFRDFPVSIESEPTRGGGALFRLKVPVPWGGARTGRRPTPEAPAPLPGFQ